VKNASTSLLPVTASRIISGSNWRHLNRTATEGARTISSLSKHSCNKLQHCLQEIFFVANKVHNVVVIAPAGGHSFDKETQIGLAQVQPRFALNKKML